jgi:hypothetical protein
MTSKRRKTCTLFDEGSDAHKKKETSNIVPAPSNTPTTVISTPPSGISFEKELPYGITHEIKIIRKQTEKDNKEKSLTMCELDDKLFVGAYAKGTHSSTMVLPCHKKFGKDAKQIGDIHTHPISDPSTIGVTPSEADFVANLNQSFASGIPQISCVVGAGKKGIFKTSNITHCFQPKQEVIEDSNKIKTYNRALTHSSNVGNDVHPYFRENIGDDFYHIWYQGTQAITKEQELDYKTSKALFDEMLGQSKKRLRTHDIRDMEKGSFCDLIQGYNMPDNNNIGRICRDELERKGILGY